MSPIHRLHRLLPIVTLVGCAAAPPRPGTAPTGPEHVKMDVVRIQPSVDPLLGLDTYDAGDVLEKANAIFDAKEWDRALHLYDRLIDQFPESSLVATALYNAALCLERLVEHELAVGRYQKVISDHPDSTSAKDAHYRLGLALAKLERWPEVEKAFWGLRQRDGLTPMDELEARVGVGVALFMQEEYATADREFLAALRFYNDHQKKQFLPATYWVAQSRFYLGEIAARQFEAVELSSDKTDEEAWKDEIASRLETKCDLLLRAQNNFIRAIREGHTGWATAAGFRIGSLYEGLYDAMIGMPVPEGIDTDATAFYREEVRKKIAVLVRKAIMVYERSLDMAQRVGENNDWVDRTSKALDRMKKLALDEMS